MEEKRLLTCDNAVFADEIVGKLEEAGIACRRHDETQDTAVGAYGALPGISIFVFEKDYEQAKALVDPIVEERNKTHPICPKCGSEDVEAYTSPERSHKIKWIVSLLFIFVALFLFYIVHALDVQSWILNDTAYILVIIGVLLIPYQAQPNFRCKNCGRKFYSK